MSPAWVAALTALATALFGLTAWVIRHGWRLLRSTYEFLIEWGGRPARHGLPATPSIPERLQSMEEQIRQVATELAKVVRETERNNGMSLHDVVDRTEKAVGKIGADQGAMRNRIEQLETQRGDREDGIS